MTNGSYELHNGGYKPKNFKGFHVLQQLIWRL